MTTTQTQDHLAQLWQESSRDLAVAFFRRAIRQDLTLAELLSVLRFENVHADLRSIRLGDVVDAPAAAARACVHAPEAPKAAPAKPQRAAKVSRRRPQQTAEIKELMLSWIRKHNAGIKTPDLSDMLQTEGYSVDTATANLILKSMEDAGQITGNQGRPRLWRAKTFGRTVPEPVVIRRAPAAVAPEAAPAAAPAAPKPHEETAAHALPHAVLLSQAEVQAAAAALRDRFFAKS
jgi:hypothetical protein